MRLLLFGLIALLATSVVQAQTKPQALQKQATSLEYSMFQAQPDVVKNPGKALFYSVGATLATFVVSPILLNSDVFYTASFLAVLAMFSFAPGAGYLYIEDSDQFLKGGVQRGLSILALGAGGLILVASLFDDLFEEDGDSNDAAYLLGYGLMLSGFGFYVYTTFRDFIGVYRDTNRYNQERNLSIRLAPVVDPVNSVYGAGFQIRF
ncbi:MAG: hypothetical protein JJ895_12400 [Balneolaceae bacterium]|nr:hypothetical protein [Balneolaceae bacterium]